MLFKKQALFVEGARNYILKDFRNAPIYIHCLFHMADLRMFPTSFLSVYTMDHDLP